MLPKWLWWVAIGVNVVLAASFLYAEAYEMFIAPCAVGIECQYDPIASPLTGAIGAVAALASVWLAWGLSERMPPAAFVAPPLLAALLALLVVNGLPNPWTNRLWWPLLGLSLVDAIFLVVASFGRQPSVAPAKPKA